MAVPRHLADARPRGVVDYALARRAALTALATGRAAAAEICDAQPYLIRAARYHGEPRDEQCPVCHRHPLTDVIYTYGDCFGADVNGRARAPRELGALARDHPEFTVFVVEVCQSCRWNHLLASYVLGTGEARKRRARSSR